MDSQNDFERVLFEAVYDVREALARKLPLLGISHKLNHSYGSLVDHQGVISAWGKLHFICSN